MSPTMSKFVSHSITLCVCELWDVFEMVGILCHQSTFPDEIFHLWQATLDRKKVRIGK